MAQQRYEPIRPNDGGSSEMAEGNEVGLASERTFGVAWLAAPDPRPGKRVDPVPRLATSRLRVVQPMVEEQPWIVMLFWPESDSPP